MKKIFLLVVSIFLLASIDSFASQEFLKNGNNFATPGYIHQEVNKKADSSELKKEGNSQIVPFFVPWEFNRTLDVPYRQQENGYFCGPACVEMVVDYYKYNPDKDQYYYANLLATTSSEGTGYNMIKEVLNQHIWSYHYDVYRGDKGFQDFLDSAYYSIKNRAPIIVNMRSEHLSNNAWPYRISGHFIVVSSMKYDQSMKRFVGNVKDPWYRSPKQYQVTYPQIYEVMMKHNQAMVY